MNQQTEKDKAILANKAKSKVIIYKNLLMKVLDGEITHKEFIEGGRKLGFDMDDEERFYIGRGLIPEGA